MNDHVHHPQHYSTSRFGVECIEFTLHMTFCAGNAFKYCFRFLDKQKPIEDLEKALVYLDWSVEHKQPAILPGREKYVLELGRQYLPVNNGPAAHLALNMIIHDRFKAARQYIMLDLEAMKDHSG